MKDKLCIVTGANSGIGKATTEQLVKLDAHVVMVVRNIEKGKAALSEIKEKIGKNSLDLMICDFSSQKSIRSFAAEFLKKYDRLDVLINNHGLMTNKRTLTKDNLELTFAVNHLGYFLLTNLLLDLLKKSAPARVINVSSGAYAATRKWPLQDYNWDKRKFSSFGAYSESKLYNIMFTYYLADKLKDDQIAVNTYTPGFTRSNFGRTNIIMKVSNILMAPIARSPQKSAKTAIYLASSSDLENVTGKYFVKLAAKETTEMTHKKEYQQELWELSEKLTSK